MFISIFYSKITLGLKIASCYVFYISVITIPIYFLFNILLIPKIKMIMIYFWYILNISLCFDAISHAFREYLNFVNTKDYNKDKTNVSLK